MFGLDWSAFWWILILLFVLVATRLYMVWPYNHFKKLGIPGPKSIPFLGMKTEFGKKPFGQIHEDLIKEYGKVVGVFTGWSPTTIVADLDMVREVLIKQFDNFCDRRYLPNRGIFVHGLFDKQGADWKRQRVQLSPYFSSGTLKMSVASINRILDNLIDNLSTKCANKEMMDTKDTIDYFTMDVICQTAFGIQVNSVKQPDLEIIKSAKEIFNKNNVTNILFIIALFFPALGRFLDLFGVTAFPVGYFDGFVRKLIQERRKQPQDSPDFIQILLEAEESRKHDKDDTKKGLSDDEIIANGILFLLAGYDTTSGALSFLLYNLTVHEEIQDKVYEEIQEHVGDQRPSYENVQRLTFLDMCFDESQRIYPLAQGAERKCVKDTVIKGVPIKEGTHVLIPIWYLQKNPEIWEDPEEFRPERFSPENSKSRDPLYHMPFGLGPRHCIGMRLAELEIKLAAVRILQKFKLVRNEKTQVPLQLDPKAFTTKSKDGIWISLEERN